MVSQSAPIFLHGITKRSGTNYTWQLLLNHPDCLPGSVGEDFLLKNADLLNQYCEKLFDNWTPKWRSRFNDSSDTILSSIGTCLIELVSCPYYLLPGYDQNRPENVDHESEKKLGNRFVTKTPDVDNLDLFFKVFPEAYLVIIVRDGRSVVESGMKSFGWDFEEAIQRWKSAAEQIIKCTEQFKDEDRRFHVVNFENLFTDSETEIKKLFSFLNLSVSRYDMEMAKSLPVFGSSEIKDAETSIHWKPIAKEKKFDPTRRWILWDEKRHSRFNWIAGKTMTKLNYSLHLTDKNNITMNAINVCLDVKNMLIRSCKKLKKVVRKII